MTLTRDGRVRRIAWWTSLIVDSQGEPISVSMGVDVTEQRQAEAELERHRLHLEEMVAERTEALRADIVRKRGHLAQSAGRRRVFPN